MTRLFHLLLSPSTTGVCVREAGFGISAVICHYLQTHDMTYRGGRRKRLLEVGVLQRHLHMKHMHTCVCTLYGTYGKRACAFACVRVRLCVHVFVCVCACMCVRKSLHMYVRSESMHIHRHDLQTHKQSMPVRHTRKPRTHKYKRRLKMGPPEAERDAKHGASQ